MVVLFLTPTHLLIQCVDNSKRSSSNITGAITNARTAHFLCGIAIITTRNGVYQREGVWDICSRAGRSDCWDICKWSIVEQSCRTSNEGNSGQKALLLPTNTNSNLHYSNVKLALFIPPKHQPAIVFFFFRKYVFVPRRQQISNWAKSNNAEFFLSLGASVRYYIDV